jgi:Bacterial SH3 domain
MRKVIAAALFGFVVWPHSAAATAYCNVLPTRDGFVALRNGPSPTARLIHRMKPGESVQLDGTEIARGGWIKVYYVGPNRSVIAEGWVNGRLIERECG